MAGPRKAASKDEGTLAGARVLVVEARYYEGIADDCWIAILTTTRHCFAPQNTWRRGGTTKAPKRSSNMPMGNCENA